MRKIFFLTALLMMIFTATAFAEETTPDPAQTDPEINSGEPYVYTSEDFGYTIKCPIKPVAVVQNPWPEPERRGEMLVFVNEGWDIEYAYMIQVNALNDTVPDFNNGSVAAIGDYLIALKSKNGFAEADLVDITDDNKGVWAVTAEKIEVVNQETGEVEGELVADKKYIYTFFRTPEGRAISIQLISASFDKKYLDTYRFSVASFQDNTGSPDKKAKKDKKKKKKQKRQRR